MAPITGACVIKGTVGADAIEGDLMMRTAGDLGLYPADVSSSPDAPITLSTASVTNGWSISLNHYSGELDPWLLALGGDSRTEYAAYRSDAVFTEKGEGQWTVVGEIVPTVTTTGPVPVDLAFSC